MDAIKAIRNIKAEKNTVPFAFLGRGSGENRFQPSPIRGRWPVGPDEVFQRAVSPRKQDKENRYD